MKTWISKSQPKIPRPILKWPEQDSLDKFWERLEESLSIGQLIDGKKCYYSGAQAMLLLLKEKGISEITLAKLCGEVNKELYGNEKNWGRT